MPTPLLYPQHPYSIYSLQPSLGYSVSTCEGIIRAETSDCPTLNPSKRSLALTLCRLLVVFDMDDVISSSQQPDNDERTITLLIFQTRILRHSRWQSLNCDLGSKRQAHDREGEVPSEEPIGEADGEVVF